ncbi:hypothetical protein PF002_g13853 [Phytophthora fragariae]|uniref:Uncharacterized protein n=1 Tax=Phytophthora fragariae TaxID=53985 RepID=A0A6A3YZQ6_9STRA|nr:hypothetical protein PF002_g13853 [Phytophthora fragariae]
MLPTPRWGPQRHFHDGGGADDAEVHGDAAVSVVEVPARDEPALLPAARDDALADRQLLDARHGHQRLRGARGGLGPRAVHTGGNSLSSTCQLIVSSRCASYLSASSSIARRESIFNRRRSSTSISSHRLAKTVSSSKLEPTYKPTVSPARAARHRRRGGGRPHQVPRGRERHPRALRDDPNAASYGMSLGKRYMTTTKVLTTLRFEFVPKRDDPHNEVIAASVATECGGRGQLCIISALCLMQSSFHFRFR